jgi:acyl-CoA reductase-like NAD-dependent aldehyde dehydrogenase
MNIRESHAWRGRTVGRHQVTALRTPADEAPQETSQHVEPPVTQVRAVIAALQQPVCEEADGAAEESQGHWQQRMTADAAGRMARSQDGIDRRHDDFSDIVREPGAEASEEDVLDVLAFAWWTIEQSQLVALDAVGM